MKSLLSILACLMISAVATADSLLPAPRRMETLPGRFSLSLPCKVEGNLPSTYPDTIARWMQRHVTTTKKARRTRRIVRAEVWTDAPSAEAYALSITPDTILIRVASAEACLRAVATLDQLATGESAAGLPCCRITDYPAYGWRGAMLDVSRHFFPMSFVRRQVDLLARYKMNRLHLHLTDAAGWRMEVKGYPRLTELAAWRTDSLWKTWWNGDRQYLPEGTPGAYGGYYTQDELRDLVAYAAERGITIIPEIEMPAHSEEVLTAYPEYSCTHEPYKQADFCPGNDSVYTFLEDVLTQVMDIFPSEYIHVGGDEAAKASWPTCKLCKARMQSEGIETVDGLQTYMMRRIGRFLRSHGRRLLGWDEIIGENLGEGTTVMVWRGIDNGARAADLGYDVVMAPGAYCYLDAYQDAPDTQPEAIGGYTTLEKVYSFVPDAGMTDAQRAHVLGVQGNLWTEYIPTTSHVEHMLYPRLLALAEIGWSGAEGRDYSEFRPRAVEQTRRLRAEGVAAFDLEHEAGDRPERSMTLRHAAVGAKITYHHPYSPYYSGGGDSTLVDGLGGGWNYSDGRWLGFIGGDTPLDVTIDLGRVQSVSSVSTDFYQNGGAWVWFPTRFTVSLSDDGEHFRTVYTHGVPIDKAAPSATEWWTWKGNDRARYVRLQGQCSEAGGWIFVDEIMVK